MSFDKITKKTDSPFFSVIIPTRNRPDLLIDAITSVLDQSFQDYELIVSDNSDNHDATIDALQSIDKWRGNHNCKYLQPDTYMHMPDHWEFCTSRAIGLYVVILTDRFVMRPSALEVMAEKIKSSPDGEPDIILWNVQSGFDDKSGVQYNDKYTGKSDIINPIDILSEFTRFSGWRDGSIYFNMLPRGMNSVYKRNLALEIIAKHGRMFPPLSPDYSSAFLFMCYSEKILYIDLPFYMSHGNKSMGSNSNIYGIHMLSTDVDPLEGCPLQIDTVFNSVVRDFLAIQNMVEPRIKSIHIDIIGYFLSNYRELIIKEMIGSPMNLKTMYECWYEGVKVLPLSQRDEIEKGKILLDKMRPPPLTILRRKLIRRLGLLPFRDYILAYLSKKNHISKGGKVYRNALKAVQETNHFLK